MEREYYYWAAQSHYREVPRWEIFMERELIFGLDLGRLVSGKNVEKAREALQIYNTEMDDFQSKILATKRDSAEAYDKMMEDLDNLKGNKKSTKCIRTWSRVSASAVSNYNLEQAQSEIRVNMEKVQNEMKKLAEAQGEILKALKSRSDSSPTRRSTLHPRKSTYY